MEYGSAVVNSPVSGSIAGEPPAGRVEVVEKTSEPGGMRRFIASFVLAAVLACFAAFVLVLLGVQGPVYLLVGGVAGLVLFVFIQWWEYIGDPVVGSLKGPVLIWPGYRLPDWAGKRKLRRQTATFAKDIRKYQRAHGDSRVLGMADHQAMTREQDATADRSERTAIFQRFVLKQSERSLAEARDMEPFDQRLNYLISKYQNRGLLNEVAVARLQQLTGTTLFLAQAAAELEGLSMQL